MTFNSTQNSSPCVYCKDVRKICELSDVIDESDDLFEASVANSKLERSPDDIFTSLELRLNDESMDQIIQDIKVLTMIMFLILISVLFIMHILLFVLKV